MALEGVKLVLVILLLCVSSARADSPPSRFFGTALGLEIADTEISEHGAVVALFAGQRVHPRLYLLGRSRVSFGEVFGDPPKELNKVSLHAGVHVNIYPADSLAMLRMKTLTGQLTTGLDIVEHVTYVPGSPVDRVSRYGPSLSAMFAFTPMHGGGYDCGMALSASIRRADTFEVSATVELIIYLWR